MQEWAIAVFGPDCAERIDNTTPTGVRHEALERFNAPDRYALGLKACETLNPLFCKYESGTVRKTQL